MQENALSPLYNNDITAEYHTPQRSSLLLHRKDGAWPDDFLPAAEC